MDTNGVAKHDHTDKDEDSSDSSYELTFKNNPNDVPVDNLVKRKNIKNALKQKDRLFLKTAAVSAGGFIDTRTRSKVWLYLTEAQDFRLQHFSEEVLQNNTYHHQVILDVARCLKRFPPSVEENRRILYQDSLTKMVVKVLCQNPELHYYQGYHDICLTFLLVMHEEEALKVANVISQSHLKYFMESTMNTTSDLLQIIYLVLQQENDQLYNHMIMSEVGTIFSLSWVITWFSHVLSDFDDIARLFDFFIVGHFLRPVYLTVAILLYKKQDILLVPCDMASMHRFLTGIPREQLPLNRLVRDALNLSIKYPPNEMIQKQLELHAEVFRESQPNLVQRSVRFVRQNVFSLTFAVLVGAFAYQLYSDLRNA